MKKHIVFDLDGTLVESLPGIAEGVRRALVSMNRPAPEPQQVRGMIGQGAKNLCALALGYPDENAVPADMLGQMYRLFCEAYPHCWQGERTQPYEGMPQLLSRLAQGGARMAVLSNKPHEVTLPMVQQIFSAVPFDPILGFTGQYPRKPAPDALLAIASQWGVPPSELTLVGDSLYDARTAANAGCRLVLVDWGYACPAELAATGAPLAHSIAELQSLLLNG